MSNRYGKRGTFNNDSELYDELFQKREVSSISHYHAFVFDKKIIKKSYVVQDHTWKAGDRLFKIAGTYYGSKEFWWIIALWNGKPTDAHFRYGDVIQIPFPPMSIYRELIL